MKAGYLGRQIKYRLGTLTLLATSPGLQGRLERVARAMESALEEIGLELRVPPALPEVSSAVGRRDFLHPSVERLMVRDAVELRGGDGVGLLFVEKLLADRWFSHWHDGPRCAVISTRGEAQLAPHTLEGFLAYEILLHGLRALSPMYAPEQIWHEDVRGCLFDLCRQKVNVTLKLRCGWICPDCSGRLMGLRLPARGLRPALDAMRELALSETRPGTASVAGDDLIVAPRFGGLANLNPFA